MRFENKVVLVSGAGKGIGKEIALAFAREGAKISFFSRDKNNVDEVSRELEKLGGDYFAQSLDITNLESLGSFLQETEKKLGKINILINNAGVGLVKKFFDTTEGDFEQVFATNLKGSFFLTQKVAKNMEEGDSVIFITSIHAQQPSLDPTYDGSKAAINSLVANLSLELADRGIRVNGIAPGHIDVQTDGVPREQDDVPLGKKAGLPADIANASLFLTDSEKAKYITGAILPVTGGLHIPIAKDIEF